MHVRYYTHIITPTKTYWKLSRTRICCVGNVQEPTMCKNLRCSKTYWK